MNFRKYAILFPLSLAVWSMNGLAAADTFQHATCEQVINHILDNLDQENKKLLLSIKKSDLQERRFLTGWGQGIRDFYNIDKGNFALMYSCQAYGDSPDFHPVATSGVIMEAVWEDVNTHPQK